MHNLHNHVHQLFFVLCTGKCDGTDRSIQKQSELIKYNLIGYLNV